MPSMEPQWKGGGGAWCHVGMPVAAATPPLPFVPCTRMCRFRLPDCENLKSQSIDTRLGKRRKGAEKRSIAGGWLLSAATGGIVNEMDMQICYGLPQKTQFALVRLLS